MNGLQNTQTKEKGNETGNRKASGKTCEEAQSVIIMETSKSITQIMAIMALMIMISGGALVKLVLDVPADIQSIEINLSKEIAVREERETALKDRVSILETQKELTLARIREVEKAGIEVAEAMKSMALNYKNDLGYIRRQWEEYHRGEPSNSRRDTGIYDN